MNDAVDALILDLLAWLAERERSYAEVMDAWRTSCPRLPIWEEATDCGLVMKKSMNGLSVVKVTPLGFAALEQHRIQTTRNRQYEVDVKV